ncbi:MAG: RNA polymerase sigma factor [Terriglobales bacterium]
MASNIQQAKLGGFAAVVPPVRAISIQKYLQIYEENRHRLYAIAFWMTDNELTAAELMENAFRRAFATTEEPQAEILDRNLISEIREYMPVGNLTLQCGTCKEISNVRRNVRRVHLERAVVQLPTTERLIFLMHDVERYEHPRIARTLGISQNESQWGLHQARLRMRELLAAMA